MKARLDLEAYGNLSVCVCVCVCVCIHIPRTQTPTHFNEMDTGLDIRTPGF